MKQILIIFLLACSINCVQAQDIKLSFKIVLSDVDGTRPIDGVTNTIISDELLAERVAFTNQLMGTYKRGFRFTFEVEEIGGQGTQISQDWYDADVNEKNALEIAALADPSGFKFKTDMVNFYLTNGSGGGCSFPDGTNSDFIILLGSNTTGWFTLYMHEIGHFFDLPHTHSNGSNPSNPSDVLNDDNTWDQDAIAQDNYSLDYNQLSNLLQDSVDYTFFNIMSYHTGGVNRNQRYYLTEGQLDQFYGSIYEFTTRDDVTHDDLIYVDLNQSQNFSCLINTGAPNSEFKALYSCALNKTDSDDDVIVIRPGVYTNAPNVISSPCVMTATRAGDVIIKP